MGSLTEHKCCRTISLIALLAGLAFYSNSCTEYAHWNATVDPSASSWNNVGMRQYKEGRYIEALESFGNSISQDDEVSLVYFNRGFVHAHHLGNYRAALEDFSNGLYHWDYTTQKPENLSPYVSCILEAVEEDDISRLAMKYIYDVSCIQNLPSDAVSCCISHATGADSATVPFAVVALANCAIRSNGEAASALTNERVTEWMYEVLLHSPARRIAKPEITQNISKRNDQEREAPWGDWVTLKIVRIYPTTSATMLGAKFDNLVLRPTGEGYSMGTSVDRWGKLLHGAVQSPQALTVTSYRYGGYPKDPLVILTIDHTVVGYIGLSGIHDMETVATLLESLREHTLETSARRCAIQRFNEILEMDSDDGATVFGEILPLGTDELARKSADIRKGYARRAIKLLSGNVSNE